VRPALCVAVLQFSIEASPSYMIQRRNIEAIAATLPHVHLIVCLRDPVTRLKSEYDTCLPQLPDEE
jgi:hypothetical protein